jgi:hypothetical protein
MDMDLAVAKLNLAELHVKKKKVRSDEPTNEAKKIRQGMLKEQITMMKGQMKKYNIKRANKIICPFYYTSSGNKTIKKVQPKEQRLDLYSFVFSPIFKLITA